MRPRLPGWVSKYVGIPFKEDGYDARGCHCWGLVHLVLREQACIEAPLMARGYANSRDVEHINRIIDGEGTFWESITAGSEVCFDVVTMTRIDRKSRNRIECHVGIVVAPGWMLHVERATRTTCESYRSGRQANTVSRFYRWSCASCEMALA